MFNYILFTAIILLPFGAEIFATKIPTKESANTKRSLRFYILTPIMGSMSYGAFAVFAAHPLLALAGSLLFYGGLTAVSNIKYKVLKSPFNAHDFDNLRNLYIYPEFYLSYVGWPIIALVIGVFASIIGVSLYFETSFALYRHIPLNDVSSIISYIVVIAAWLLALNVTRFCIGLFFNEKSMAHYGVTLELKQDIARFGLFPTGMLYRLLLKIPSDKTTLQQRPYTVTSQNPSDIIAIQGESYFDLERLFRRLPKAQQTTWKNLRDLEKAGVTTGEITVPAWGAYTMQTEFSFLSMLHNNLLGVDRINPYMRFAQQPVTTLASVLNEAGYRTICIHPAKKEFFRRSDVMPNMGFDEFIGLEAFENAPLYGKYISDSALGEKINALIAEHHSVSNQPLFIFAITIESHGPWANGRLDDHLNEAELTRTNPTGDTEFSLYQQHMDNLMALFRSVSVDTQAARPRTVALYGDHMPALDPLFQQHGFTEQPTDYLLWNSAGPVSKPNNVQIEKFGETVLKEAGVTLTKPSK